MNKKMKWLGIFALAASLLLTACGAQPAEAVPTSTPEPTATPEAAAAEPTEEPTAEPVSQPAERSTGIVNMAEDRFALHPSGSCHPLFVSNRCNGDPYARRFPYR